MSFGSGWHELMSRRVAAAATANAPAIRNAGDLVPREVLAGRPFIALTMPVRRAQQHVVVEI